MGVSWTAPGSEYRHKVIASAWAGCWPNFRGGRWEHIASLHPKPFVLVEESHYTGGNPVDAEHSGSKGVNIKK